MQIFLSYATEDRDLAEEIQLALLGSGHKVFFDKASLPAGGDYHSRIESAVKQSDFFVFLISPNSVAQGSYALTELKFARTKWPHPKERLLPVRLHGTAWEAIPPYLKSITVLEPEGSIAAEIVAAVAVLSINIAAHDTRAGAAGVQDTPAINNKREVNEGSSKRTPIWVAIIGTIGLLGAALIGSWFNLFGPITNPPVPSQLKPETASRTASEPAAAERRAAAEQAAAQRVAAEMAEADRTKAERAAAEKAVAGQCTIDGRVFHKDTGSPFPAVFVDVLHFAGDVKNMQTVEISAATTGPDGSFKINCNSYPQDRFPLMLSLRRSEWVAQHIVGKPIAKDQTDKQFNFGIAPEMK